MSEITIDQLSQAMPIAKADDLAKYLEPLDETLEKFEINTPARIAAFLAQTAHESDDFSHTEENLNYAWQALRKTWPTHFETDAIAQAYHRQPEKIANRAYASRTGNGDEASFTKITQKINGGLIGQDDRLQNWAEARAVFLV